MIFNKKKNSKLNNNYIKCGVPIFFVAAIIFVNFGQSAVYELNNILESINIKVCPKGLVYTVLSLRTLFKASDFAGWVMFVFNMVCVGIPLFLAFIFQHIDKIDKSIIKADKVVCKNYTKEKTTYTVNSRILC